ncbi:MAG: hypothetical protein LLF75_10110 [Eubacteriales bacterium]|nr:hypothetical protein [Eubacteriales bacterium]
MNWKNIDKRQLITILICVFGTFVLSLLRIPALENNTTSALGDINAYASLEDVGIFASVMALGVPWGVIAPVLGIILGDIVMGSKYFILGNLLIKSLMGLFVAAFAAKCDNWKKSFVVAGMTEAIMLVLFFVYDLLIIREFKLVGTTLLMQLIQGVVCVLLGAAVLRFMPVMEPDRMLEIRRPAD